MLLFIKNQFLYEITALIMKVFLLFSMTTQSRIYSFGKPLYFSLVSYRLETEEILLQCSKFGKKISRK